ncbi:Hypothetical predicted protein [Olea europaea subsp. europaea]|uniref:DUF1985 domain-containing protein n=1 Tax=Olea europaea subsp. europaea TaxID=158383 RepID=A0A8S0VIV2_OLEEU|nr:Hypothetical predicted protein [Olea europaea subsp. europaea]
MEYIYNIDDRCEVKVTTRSNVSNVEKVYEALDNVHKELFLKSCFGKLYDIKNMKISAQLIHNLLLRRVVSVNEDELWFFLGLEKVARFSLYEFMLITGLSPTDENEYENQINEDGRLNNKYFPTSSKVTLKELDEAFEKELEDMDDKYKLGLVLIYETVLRSKEKNTSIDLRTLDIVDDLELFNEYPCGTKSFNFTIHAFLRVSKNPKPKYYLWGFPQAIEVWAFESIPQIANMYHARLPVNGLPRMCR